MRLPESTLIEPACHSLSCSESHAWSSHPALPGRVESLHSVATGNAAIGGPVLYPSTSQGLQALTELARAPDRLKSDIWP